MTAQPLAIELQRPKTNLDEFAAVTERMLNHLQEIVSSRTDVNEYVLYSSTIAGNTKRGRPIKRSLFIDTATEFRAQYAKFESLLDCGQQPATQIANSAYDLVDCVVYTMQQAIGVGLDFLGEPNSSRKHVGNRFEELIRAIISRLNVTHEKIIFKIPYVEDGEQRTYSCETDMVLTSEDTVQSSPQSVHENEIVISLKTSSKDRMGKIFLDKMLMSRFATHPVRVVGIFHNDVQRKRTDGVSFTFVSGLFMVYTKFLTQLDGVYFIDPPPKALTPSYQQHISRFSTFLLRDIWQMMGL